MSHFEAATGGFAVADVTESDITVSIIDYTGTVLYSFIRDKVRFGRKNNGNESVEKLSMNLMLFGTAINSSKIIEMLVVNGVFIVILAVIYSLKMKPAGTTTSMTTSTPQRRSKIKSKNNKLPKSKSKTSNHREPEVYVISTGNIKENISVVNGDEDTYHKKHQLTQFLKQKSFPFQSVYSK